MKGLSLPINTIVIVAIAVLVLVVIAGFFGGFFSLNVLLIQREDALSKACQQWKTMYNCDYDYIDDAQALHKEPGEASERLYSVEELCKILELSTDQPSEEDNPCLRKCGCAVTATT